MGLGFLGEDVGWDAGGLVGAPYVGCRQGRAYGRTGSPNGALPDSRLASFIFRALSIVHTWSHSWGFRCHCSLSGALLTVCTYFQHVYQPQRPPRDACVPGVVSHVRWSLTPVSQRDKPGRQIEWGPVGFGFEEHMHFSVLECTLRKRCCSQMFGVFVGATGSCDVQCSGLTNMRSQH
jgi:hypothetical protein